MIKVSVLYPNTEGSRFDLDYYMNTHVKLAEEKLAPALKSFSVDYGIMGGAPGAKPPFHAVGHLLFDSLEEFIRAFMPHMAELQSDIPNYTDVEGIIQISEVKIL